LGFYDDKLVVGYEVLVFVFLSMLIGFIIIIISRGFPTFAVVVVEGPIVFF